MTQPIYYRWAYSPTTGDVTLSHNNEGPPSEIRFHSQMIQERPESDVEVGFAYRYGGGWKLYDADHKQVEDPHAAEAIRQAVASYDTGGTGTG